MKLKNKIATSNIHLGLFPTHEAISILAKLGYDAIEIWAERLELQISKKQTSLAKVKKSLKDNNMENVIHAPLRDLRLKKPKKFNICSQDKKFRDYSVKKTLQAIELAKKLNSKAITIHPGRLDNLDDNPNDYWDLQIKAFKKFSRAAGRIKIGLEPMEKRPLEFVLDPKHADKIIKAVKAKNLGITFDLVHAYTHGVNKPIEFMDRYHKKKVFHCHVSGHNKQKPHVPFSMTRIPHKYLDKVIRKLVKNYSGIISIEGTTNKILPQTKKLQKDTVTNNLAYIRKEIKCLHLE